MSGLSFLPAEKRHARQILAMRQAVAADLTGRLSRGPWSGSSSIASIRERIASPDLENLRKRTILVAERNGEAVGSLAVTTFPPNFWKKQYWRQPKAVGLGVVGLAVFPDRQRQGVGRFLMESVEALARDHGIPFVRLDAFADNPFSNAFYRGVGYDERVTIDLRGVGLVLFEKASGVEEQLHA